MGAYNSSTTRVVPVFDRLMDSDPTGHAWLRGLLTLGSRADAVPLPEGVGLLPPKHPRSWGHSERRLKPPLSLLEYLVRNITPAQVDRAGDDDPVRALRMSLAMRDDAVLQEALRGIRTSPRPPRAWYLLEGPSSPDACLETSQLLLVIEGKRTEATVTSHTKWMPARSQLVRHMDAAMEVADGRLVLGLLIVEGANSASSQLPSSHWLEASDAQFTAHALERSLPHRSAEERRGLYNGYLGVTTWQAICSRFSLRWPPVDDAV